MTGTQLDLGLEGLPTQQTPLPEADEWWRDGAARAVEALAASGGIFQISDIRKDPYSIPEPHHPSQWGALAHTLAADGTIQQVGWARSTAPTRHGAVVSLWRAGKRAAHADEPAGGGRAE